MRSPFGLNKSDGISHFPQTDRKRLHRRKCRTILCRFLTTIFC